MDPGNIPGIYSLPFELLDRVLLHLSMQFLLVTAQRVCRTWSDCILKSTRLQRKLFFKPIPDNEPRVVNPLLASKFPFFGMGTNTGYEANSYEPLENSIINWPEYIFIRPNASWRRMLIQQPPVRALGWLEHMYPKDPTRRHSVRRWYLPFPNGVYMSAFYDLIITPPGGEREQQEIETTWTSALGDSSQYILLRDTEGGNLDWGAFLGRAAPEVVLQTHDRDAQLPIHRMVSFWGLLQTFKYPFEDQALAALRESIRPYRGEETSNWDVAALYID